MAEGPDEADFEQVDDSKNISQLVRSNAPHYWRYMKNEADLHHLRRFLPFEGVVAGDPHMGNFGILPLRDETGVRQLKYVNIDFDDAGRAPFVLDFIHYVISAKAIGSDVKIRPLADTYVEGVAGRETDPPKKLKRLLEMAVADYDAMAERYAEKHSSNRGFRFEPGKIEPYDGPITRSRIEALFDTEAVVDLAIRPVVRGGSAGELRIWILTTGGTTHRRIVELKQYAKPTTAIYRSQPPIREWLKEVRNAFWPGLAGLEYDLVKIAANGWFWIREKRASLIDVPYSSKSDKRIEFRGELARYDANQLGLAHGRQMQGSDYFRAIKADTKAFRVAVKQIAIDYLKLAQEAEGRKSSSGAYFLSSGRTPP